MKVNNALLEKYVHAAEETSQTAPSMNNITDVTMVHNPVLDILFINEFDSNVVLKNSSHVYIMHYQHVFLVHMRNRLVYLCPFCQVTQHQAYSVS